MMNWAAIYLRARLRTRELQIRWDIMYQTQTLCCYPTQTDTCTEVVLRKHFMSKVLAQKFRSHLKLSVFFLFFFVLLPTLFLVLTYGQEFSYAFKTSGLWFVLIWKLHCETVTVESCGFQELSCAVYCHSSHSEFQQQLAAIFNRKHCRWAAWEQTPDTTERVYIVK